MTYNTYFKSLQNTFMSMKDDNKKGFKISEEENKVLIINDHRKHGGYKLSYLNKPPVPMVA